MITIDSKITLVSGLHIGGSDDSMKIGGVDSPVIKRDIFADEQTGKITYDTDARKVTEPYIPGSSLKGKIRSLLEHHFGLITSSNVVDSNTKVNGKEKYIDLIVKLFGESGANKKSSDKNIHITRAIFRDCFITDEIRKAYLANKIDLFEEKHENVIDRITGTTIGGGLRHIERVQSAIEFDFNLSIRTFQDDDTELFKDALYLGIKLLEVDALGGSGSRGYGRISFNDIDGDIKSLSEKIDIKLK